ncbi:DUF3631 domain-containing protein [Kutzneria sp. CA-103260]|uniref:DUF3631 domain-containing protein n=1 Tax=Kutzneria sp. CA-103260 TaxID=2802641 RepID=UPI001BA99815|nr:DUF3631 domain-containing protein [Kutzneria sp. CA-103260]QUQ70572.1 hypothetical protein JJ691_83520 [Kutzneria sp. CA-103260]
MTAALRIVPPGAPQLGHEILDDVRDFVARFSAFPSLHCAPTLALWYAHTWAAEHFYITPRLVLSSAEPESGKTRVLEVGKHFTRAPELTTAGSAAAMVRMIAAGPITLLFDEVDAVFTAGGSGNEEVRNMLNSGYKRGATIPKCKGDSASGIVVERLPVFAPTALAGLFGCIPATVTTRAITMHLRKRRHDQHVEPYNEKRAEKEAEPTRDALAGWITGIGEELGDAEPVMPEGVADRAAEIWEPLLAIADAAGGHWPDTARAACVDFVHTSKQAPTSLGVQLLADLQVIFEAQRTDRIPTGVLLAELTGMEEAPWGEMETGKPLTDRRLAKELRKYFVAPTTFRTGTGGRAIKGYVTFPTHDSAGEQVQVGLADAWSRYVLSNSRNKRNSRNHAGQTVTATDSVTATEPQPTAQPPLTGMP